LLTAAARSVDYTRSTRLTPAELAELDHPTPYLLMDLEAVDQPACPAA
jgi:hypothetical protein